MKKYEFTEETKRIGNIELHRVRALCDFKDVKSGDLGGWIEREENLSHEGSCWVYGDAQVCDNAQVYGSAQVCDNARVCVSAWVCGGEWDKSPLYIQGTRWSFNGASDTKIQVGCQRHTWQEWHDKFREIAAEHAGEDIIPEYVQYFNLACKLYSHEDCLIEEV